MPEKTNWMNPKPSRIDGAPTKCPACGTIMCVIDDDGFTKCPNDDDPRTVLRRLAGMEW